MPSKLTIELDRVAEIRRIVGDGDPDLLHDMVEGETDLFELMDWLLDKEAEEDAFEVGILALLARLNARRQACEGRQGRLRQALHVCMAASGQRSLRRPSATLSLKAIPPSIAAIDESVLPEAFWQTTRSVSRSAIKEALKTGQSVGGVTLSNGGETLQVRR